MYKERSVVTTDYGDTGDAKYYPASQYTYYPPSETYLKILYNEGRQMRNYAVVISPTSGIERFSSTTFRKPAYNNCHHEKSNLSVCYPFTVLYRQPGISYSNMFRYWRRPSVNLAASSPVQYNDWDGARRRAWWSMQPRFEGEISMLNFLYELKDFKDIMRHAAKPNYRELGATLRKLKSDFLRNKRKGLNNKPFDPTLPLANIRLINEYAIKPTLRDISDIHKQLGIIVRAAQEQFQTRGFETQKSHYSETVDHVVNLVKIGSSESTPYSKGYVGKSKFTATMSYTYDYEMRNDIDAFLKFWGLTGNWEVFWNATPFTFLADYFIKIGKAVHMMEYDRNVNLIPSQYCESTLHESLAGTFNYTNSTSVCHWLVNADRYYPVNTEPFLLTGVRSTIYDRVNTSPNKGSALPRFAVPTWGQTANMLALARCFLN